jgi:predicted ATP-binding protein involved in virulence
MNSTATFRLDRLQVRNFRCFAECVLELHPKLTVLVAENGQGKTAILDGIAAAMAPVVNDLADAEVWPGLAGTDHRLLPNGDGPLVPAGKLAIRATAVMDGAPMQWSVAIRRSDNDLDGLRAGCAAAKEARGNLADPTRIASRLAPPLPLVAYYGTGRLSLDERRLDRRRRQSALRGRLCGYEDRLSSGTAFRTFETWFKSTVQAAGSSTSFAHGWAEHPVKLLAAVREATSKVLQPTGWGDLDFPQAAGQGMQRQLIADLTATHPEHGRLPLFMLSDGVRTMVALIGDIAHRCARLNPQFGELAAQRTPGVLLIDEIDLHLHPGWQQQVVGLLESAFPEMQIILTTHSPQVLTSVDAQSIRIIRHHDGETVVDTPEYQTLGVESADVLARVMGVHPVPEVEQAQWLSQYTAMVQTGAEQTPKAVVLWGRIVGHFGSNHPVLHQVNVLRRLREFVGTQAPRPQEAKRNA